MSALLSRLVRCTGLKVLFIALALAGCGVTANQSLQVVSLGTAAATTIVPHVDVAPGDVVPVAVTVSEGGRRARRCWSCSTPRLHQSWYREAALPEPRRKGDGVTIFVETFVAPSDWWSEER
jgi:hypothetical protein